LAIVVAPIIVLAAVSAFAWPAARLAPRELPIAVAGPTQVIAPLVTQLARKPDAFDVHVYSDGAAARVAIEHRHVYGALVPSPTGLTVMTASAASPTVAQQIAAVARQTSTRRAVRPPHIVDVVPASTADPHQAALSSAVLPLVLTGTLTGLVITMLISHRLARLGGLIVASILVGLATNTVIQSWLGVIGGHWRANAAVLSLTVLAISSTVVGLGAVLGNAGRAIASMLMVLLGNPFSGVTSAPELLPQPAGRIGQLLPPGATVELLRSSAFFNNHGAPEPATVLAVWAALGLLAVLLANVPSPHRSPAHAAGPGPGGRKSIHSDELKRVRMSDPSNALLRDTRWTINDG
jgi:hypothetical protein